MRKKIHKFVSLLMVSVMVLACPVLPINSKVVQAAGATVKENVETAASEGNVMVGIEGVYITSDLQTLLNEINKVRKEACEAGNVPDPRDTSRMLTTSDYVPLQIGKSCQRAAEIRAAEASIEMGHTRPNGKKSTSVFTALNSGKGGAGENLAWHSLQSTKMTGWTDEKDKWISTGGVWDNSTGHYANLINPNYKYTGIATFNPAGDTEQTNWACTAGSYARDDEPLTSLPGEQNQKVIQKVEVPLSKIVEKKISGNDSVILNKTASYSLSVTLKFTTKYERTVYDCPIFANTTWTSSNPGTLSIDANGLVTGKKEGKTTITATAGAVSATKNIEVTVYKNEWVDGVWYDANGNNTYNGRLQWKSNSSGWWVEDTSGWYPQNQWQKIDGKWYYFTSSGYMDYSEYRDGCWLNSDGSWNQDYSNGKWQNDGQGWWYQDNGWYPRNQYLWIDGTRYWFNSSGYTS